ncbi:MAG: hypothetical protein NC914_00040 [Candidatus Omnitrophica bacterium]|nr:hypothetical protein [Candidatus Omnitrophota bacterium]
MRLVGKRSNQAGQAVVELAVLGSIIIMLLVWMLGIGQNMLAQQEVTMYSFRRALHLARKRSQEGCLGAVSYTTFTALSPINPLNTRAQASEISGSGSVMWENESFAIAPASIANDADRADSPLVLYQYKDKVVRMPYILVKRKPTDHDLNQGSQYWNLFKEVVEFVNAAATGNFDAIDDTAYYAYESQPIWDNEKKIEEEYSISRQDQQQGSLISAAETTSNTLVTTTTFKTLPEDKIKDWDSGEIEEIKDFDVNPGSNFKIIQTQTLEGNKQWQSSTN